MKKLKGFIAGLLILLFIGGMAYAIESSIYTFYRLSPTTSWTSTANGASLSVLPFTQWTCQAATTSSTALTVRVAGNITGTAFATNTPIATHTCNTADLAGQNYCGFTFTTTPMLQMRMDVTTLTGSSTDKIICIGGLN